MKKILLSLIALVAVAFNASAAEVIVGNEDNSTKFWTAFNDYVTLGDGDQVNISFTNYSDKVNNYDNWLAVCTNDVDRNDDANGYFEYFVLRADNYAWGTGGWNSAENPEKGTLTNDYNWDTFKEDMDGSKVAMTFKRSGNVLSLKAVITTTSGKTYTETWEQTVENLPEKIRFFLTVEGGHLALQYPDYTAVGTASGYYTAYNYTAIYTGTVPYVEVYLNSEGAKEKVIARNWCGVEGYDIAFIFNSEGSITDSYPIINDEEKIPSTASSFSYVETGLTTDYVVACFGKNYIYTWQSDDKTTEYIWFAPYMYIDEACTSYLSGNYEYYLSWTVGTSGISSISADKSSVEGPAYNLAGQRVSKDAKGLVIVNGKKYFNK